MSTGFIDRPCRATRREHTLAAPYERFTRAFESMLGVMTTGTLTDLGSAAEARARLESFVGPSGFTLFQTVDHGGLLTAFTGRKVRATTFVFGNGLIAIEMTKHVPEVGLYVPLRLYVIEKGPNHLLLTYDRPSAMLGQFASKDVDRVAEMLDAKVESLIARAAQVATSAEPQAARA
jgi:uncharacterized protein (DUF302 family)